MGRQGGTAVVMPTPFAGDLKHWAQTL